MKNEKLFKNSVEEPMHRGSQIYPPNPQDFSALSDIYKVSYEIIFSEEANNIRVKRAIEFRSKRGIDTSNEWIEEFIKAQKGLITVEISDDIAISYIEKKIFDYIIPAYNREYGIENSIKYIYIRELSRYTETDINRLKDPFYFANHFIITTKEELKKLVDRGYFIVTDIRSRTIRPLSYDDESIIGTSPYIIAKRYLDFDATDWEIPLKIK